MNWHARYQQQATWTASLREYLFKKVDLASARSVLEVGCGTGAILSKLNSLTPPHGLDLSQTALAQARKNAPQALLVRGDAHHLPYPDGTFDLTCCHFLLLWLSDPLRALQEMRRVSQPGAHILALAEPDYSARVDAPPELARLGELQTEALRAQGADSALGGRLADLFAQAGIELRETGAMQPAQTGAFDRAAREMEWAVLETDLAGTVPAAKIREYKNADLAAWQRGERVLYIPTYFAWGQA
jgi:SAM-dependent methyltransferase